MASEERVIDWLAQRGGVAHTAEARARGFSGRAIADAVDAGVKRVRRSWLVGLGAAPQVVAAIAAGGRVSCVTAARRSGLWVPDHEDEVHIAVKPTASRVGDAEPLAVHWAVGPVPVAKYATEDPIVNVLFHVARCLPREDALTVWESSLNKELIDRRMLTRIEWGSTHAAALAELASSLSDSGLETLFLARVSAFGLALRQQVLLDGRRVDFLIGDRLVVQWDGFAHHSSPKDRRRDIEADARLALLGFTVLRFDWKQVVHEWPSVERTVLTAVAQGLHRAT